MSFERHSPGTGHPQWVYWTLKFSFQTRRVISNAEESLRPSTLSSLMNSESRLGYFWKTSGRTGRCSAQHDVYNPMHTSSPISCEYVGRDRYPKLVRRTMLEMTLGGLENYSTSSTSTSGQWEWEILTHNTEPMHAGGLAHLLDRQRILILSTPAHTFCIRTILARGPNHDFVRKQSGWSQCLRLAAPTNSTE